VGKTHDGHEIATVVQWQGWNDDHVITGDGSVQEIKVLQTVEVSDRDRRSAPLRAEMTRPCPTY
jgi:hypothetical protein